MDTITSSDSPISQQFCAFCLREKLPNVEFYKHIVRCSVELQKWLQIILGYEFRLQNFDICEPCWEIMQLIQDFRLRCLMANSLVERIAEGWRSEDSWFSVRNLANIESIKMIVKNQLLQIEKVEIGLEVSKESGGHQQLKQSGTEEASEEVLKSTLDIGEVKVELNGVDSDQQTDQCVETKKSAEDMPMVHNVQIKSEPDAENKNASEQLSITKTDKLVTQSDDDKSTASEANNQQFTQNVYNDSTEEVLESIMDIGEVKIEPEVKDKELQFDKMNTKSDDDFSEQNAESIQQGTSGLVQCEKCSRMFKPSGYTQHLQICDGKIPDRIYDCPHCPMKFAHLFKLNAHVNKHTGKKPFQCRGNCRKEFASAWVRYRHERICGKELKQCTLCDKTLENQVVLNEHYKLEHQGEKRFPCSRCDKRFNIRNQLKRHERTHSQGDYAKPFTCNECSKSFAESYYLKRHIETAHSEREVYQCANCDRQFKLQISLEIHVASKHPELASERAKKSLARMQDRCEKVKIMRKQVRAVPEKRRRKFKEKKSNP